MDYAWLDSNLYQYLALLLVLVAGSGIAVWTVRRRARRLAPPTARPQISDAGQRPQAVQDLAPGLEPKVEAPAQPAAPAADTQLGLGLSRSRASLWGRMAQILGQAQQVDDAVFDALEEVLLTCDIGVAMTLQLITALREAVRHTSHDAESLRALLREQLRGALLPAQAPTDALARPDSAAGDVRPRVILFVGVNGVGKTTTIGKIAHKLVADKQKVVLAAGDTFRAAAAEQLAVWGERTGARVVRGAERADPSSVMFNAMQAAIADDADVLLADTAGRLHTNTELMEEIKKARRALGKVRAKAPDETWLVVDATSGQNALHQAKEFHQALGLTGIILTKLDGTAKGGIVVAIAASLGLTVRYVGVGESADALRPFDAEAFVQALL